MPNPVSYRAGATISKPAKLKPEATAKPPRPDSTARKTDKGVTRDTRNAEGVIFVPYFIRSKLRTRVQNEDNKLTQVMRMPRVRYVERTGRTIADSLVTKDPWYLLQGGCSKVDCTIC